MMNGVIRGSICSRRDALPDLSHGSDSCRREMTPGEGGETDARVRVEIAVVLRRETTSGTDVILALTVVDIVDLEIDLEYEQRET